MHGSDNKLNSSYVQHFIEKRLTEVTLFYFRIYTI